MYAEAMVPAYPRKEAQQRILDAVAIGWTLERLEGRAGWPSRQTIYRWTVADPGFGALLKEARGLRRGSRIAAQAGPVFNEAQARAFLIEVRRGHAVRDLVRQPAWPNRDRLNRWKLERPDFASDLEAAVRFSREERPKRWALYDEAAADQIILRLNKGEPVTSVCSDRDLPGKAALRHWRRLRPDFDRAVKTAERAGHRRRMAKQSLLTEGMFDEILELLATGHSLRQVGEMPGMPHRVTMQVWMTRDPAFEKMVRWAREQGRIAKVMREGARRIAEVDAAAAAALAALEAQARD